MADKVRVDFIDGITVIMANFLNGIQDELDAIEVAIPQGTDEDNPLVNEERLQEVATKTFVFSVTLLADDWVDNSQTITDSKFIAGNYEYIVTPDPSNYIAYGSAQVYADDDTDGHMIFNCVSVPEEDLVVNISRKAVEVAV